MIKKTIAMAQPKKSIPRGCLHFRTLRYAFLLLAVLFFGGIFYNLMVDEPRDAATADPMGEDTQEQGKSIYDTLDVLRDYLWKDVMKSAKTDSALRAERAKAEKEREAKEKARERLVPTPATDKDVDALEEMGSQPSQAVPTPAAPPQPSAAAPKIDKVASPRVEAIGNE